MLLTAFGQFDLGGSPGRLIPGTLRYISVARRAFTTSVMKMGDAVVKRGGADRFEGRGLVPIVNPTYGAPGGEYSLITIVHEEECLRGTFDADIRANLATTRPTTFHQVEAVVRALLLAGGCPPTCVFDRATTMGLFARFHSPPSSMGSEFVPSQAHCEYPDSQLTSPESSYVGLGLASDAFTVLSGVIGGADMTASSNPTQSTADVRVDVPASQIDRVMVETVMEELSPGERKLHRNFKLDRSSDDDFVPSGDRANEVSSPVIGGGGSGFNSQGLNGITGAIGGGGRLALPVSKRHLECVAHTRERRGNSPLAGNNDILTTSQVVDSQSLIVRDTPMDMGKGRNSEGTGMGDSIHAAPTIDDESQDAQYVPSVIVLPSSPMPALSPPLVSLPATAASLSQATVGMLEGLEDIEMGRAVPVDGMSSCSGDSGDSVSCRLFGGRDGYRTFDEVAVDMELVASIQEDGRKATRILMDEVGKLSALVANLKERVERCGCGIKPVTRADMARVMNPDRPDEAAAAVGDGLVSAVDGEAKKKDKRPSQRRRAAAKRKMKEAERAVEKEDEGEVVTALVEVADVMGGAALYSSVTAKAPPPKINWSTRPREAISLSPSIPTLPAPVRLSGPHHDGIYERSSSVPESTPTPNARARHVTMRFEARKRTQLPVAPETIIVRLNQSLSNLGKVNGQTP